MPEISNAAVQVGPNFNFIPTAESNMALGGVVTPRTTVSFGPSTPVPAPGPMQSGVSPICNAWETPANGVGCVDFALFNGISTLQLYEWNPILGPTGEHCGEEFQFNEYYCVGVVQGKGGVTSTSVK